MVELDNAAPSGSKAPKPRDALFVSLAVIQISLFILYIIFVDYPNATNAAGADFSSQFVDDFPSFENIHIMTFVGFGFLMVFIRKYSFTGVGVNMLLGALSLQWGILCVYFWDEVWNVGGHSFDNSLFGKIQLDINHLINGDFAACAVAISMGVVLGKVSHLQLVWMVVFEVAFYSINRVLVFNSFDAIDQGGCMYIHTFAACFGVGFSRFVNHFHPELHDVDVAVDTNQHSVYHSDLFAMIGTLFLFCFFPSFNAALLSSALADRHRVVINTVFSLSASNVTAFALSHMLRGEGKFNIRDAQNSTLSGGVIIASCSAILVHPWGALLLGAVGGMLAMLGQLYVSDFMWSRLGIHDTRGVFSVHGLPGIVGGIAGAISAASWSADTLYGGENIAVVFPARALGGRTSGMQGSLQMAALGTSVGIGLAGGVITALALGSKRCPRPKPFFTESDEWQVPEKETPLFYAEQEVNKRRIAAGLPPLVFE